MRGKFLPNPGGLRCGVLTMPGRRIDDEPIGAEGLLVKKNLLLEPQGRVELLVVVLSVGGNIDAQIANDAFGYRTIRRRALDRVGAAVAQHEGLVDLELVALGVSPEIIVVLQDENPRRLSGGLVKEACGREAADAATHDDQVVAFTGAFGLPCVCPECTVA